MSERKRKIPYEENHKVKNGIEHKLCSICGEWIPMNRDYYYANKSNGVDGFNPYCKECSRIKNNSYYHQNRDIYLVSQKEWYKDNREGKIEHSKKWIQENKEQYRSNYKKWQRNNKDKLNEYRLHRDNNKKHEISDWEWIICLEYFNYACAYCGMPEEMHYIIHGTQLHKEHVIHNGNNFIDNCVPSCRSCNSSKHEKEFIEWYNERNPEFSKRRLNKIINWMTKISIEI